MFREEKNHFDEFKIQNAKSFHETLTRGSAYQRKMKREKELEN